MIAFLGVQALDKFQADVALDISLSKEFWVLEHRELTTFERVLVLIQMSFL